MELELRIVRDPCASLPKQRVRVFGEAGGNVGRAHDNYWLLPDPKCLLSGRHCDILFRDGSFWVRDTSRNGVFVNGSEQPLGFGRKERLKDGDELVFATYKVQVRIRARGSRTAARPDGALIDAEELFGWAGTSTEAVASLQAAPIAPPSEPAAVTQQSGSVPEQATALAVTADAPSEEQTGEHAIEELETHSRTEGTSRADDEPSSQDQDEIVEPVAAPQSIVESRRTVESTGQHEQWSDHLNGGKSEADDGESDAPQNVEADEEDREPAPADDPSSPVQDENVEAVAAPQEIIESYIVVESTGEHEQWSDHSDDGKAEADDGTAGAPPNVEADEEDRKPAHVDEAASQPAELLATRVLDPAMIAAELSKVVHVDRERMLAVGYLPPPKIERLIANQFRHIKRPLIKNALGRGAEPVPNGHLVMVTSSLPGEGKTFSSLNLALSLAREKDLEVVLIDADIAKQHVSRIFGLKDAPGLLNALADDLIDVESLILPTNIKGFSILPAGHCTEEDVATELLASTRMEEVAARIGARSAHRIALFDSPPLLLTNEARVLVSLVGQILLVVRAGVTPQQAVTEALTYVDEEKPLGLVLNQSKGHAPGSYYGYGSYGYGSYGDTDDK